MFAVNPVRFALSAAAVVPDPIDCAVVDVKVDSVLEVPHSNHAVVAAPFGLTLPFIVADVVVTDVAAVVVTAGRSGIVTKLNAVGHPLVPPVFFALTRQ